VPYHRFEEREMPVFSGRDKEATESVEAIVSIEIGTAASIWWVR
jgi:hypothetical protein